MASRQNDLPSLDFLDSTMDPADVEKSLANHIEMLSSRQEAMLKLLDTTADEQQTSLRELNDLKRQRNLLSEQLRDHERLRAEHGHQLAYQERQRADQSQQQQSGPIVKGAPPRGQPSPPSCDMEEEQDEGVVEVRASRKDVARIDEIIDELEQYTSLGRAMILTVEEGPMTMELEQSVNLAKEVVERFNELHSSFLTLREAVIEFNSSGDRQTSSKKKAYESILAYSEDLESNFEAAKRCFVSTSQLLQMAVDKRRDWAIRSAGLEPLTAPHPQSREATGKLEMSGLTGGKGSGDAGRPQRQELFRSLPPSSADAGRPQRQVQSRALPPSSADAGRPLRPEPSRALPPDSGDAGRPQRQQLFRSLPPSSADAGRPQRQEQSRALPPSLGRPVAWGEMRAEDDVDDDDDEEDEQPVNPADMSSEMAMLRQLFQSVSTRQEGGERGLAGGIPADVMTQLRERRSQEECEVKALLEQRNQLARQLQQIHKAKTAASAAADSLARGDDDPEDLATMMDQIRRLRDMQGQMAGGTSTTTAKVKPAEESGEEDDDDEEEDEDQDEDEGEGATEQMVPELEARIHELEEKKRELGRLRGLLGMLKEEYSVSAEAVGASGDDQCRVVNGKANRDSVTFQEPIATFMANEELYENMREARMWREELRGVGASQSRSPGVGGGAGVGSGVNGYREDGSRRSTAATWGGSSSGGGDLDLDPIPTRGAVPPPPSATGDARYDHLQSQVESIAGMCRQMMLEQSNLAGKITQLQQHQQPNVEMAGSMLVPYSCEAVASGRGQRQPAQQQQHTQMETQMVAAVQACSSRLSQLQMHMTSMHQQLQMFTCQMQPWLNPWPSNNPAAPHPPSFMMMHPGLQMKPGGSHQSPTSID